MTAAIALERVTVGYGATTVLRDVDLVAPPGAVTALIGPNGAGKTTLLNTASGLLQPQRGRILVDGRDMTNAPVHVRVQHGICHVPEGRAIFRSLTVRENLTLHDRGQVYDPLDRAVQAFPRLGERMGQVAGTLSGGEQQMLALARAWVTTPRCVLLDEVSMGLAPILVEEIFEFLSLLATEGVALLVVEQYVSQILAMADVVYVLKKGAVTFAGQPSEVDADELAAEYLGTAA